MGGTRWVRAGLFVVALAVSAVASEPGLVGHWNFDSVVDDQIPDLSGQNNLARNHGARQVKRGGGYALRFDGVKAYVDCGDGESLRLKTAATVSAWVCPEARPTGEPAIVAKRGPTVYGLTFYKDGRCWWYISSGGNSVNSPLTVGEWTQIVGTYDGGEMRLYMNGKLTGARKLSAPISQGGRLLIGKRDDGAQFFRGMIDDVKIYNRALSEAEVVAQYQSGVSGTIVQRDPLAGSAVQGVGFALRVGPKGGMEVAVGEERYAVESTFSYPGEAIGFNDLCETDARAEVAWKPDVAQRGNGWTIRARGAHYALERTVRVEGHRIVVEDTLSNVGQADVGVIVTHRAIAAAPRADTWVCGVPGAGGDEAENPTVLLAQANSQLGLVAEDSVSRTQFQARASVNQGAFGLRHLGMGPGRRVTLRWTLYPQAVGGDYWAFINRLRGDWGVNFTIRGPGNMLHVTSPEFWPVFTDKQRCARWLARNKVKVLNLAPWLDYDNLNHLTGGLTTRAEYKEIMRRVRDVVKSVDPDVKILGDIEAPFVSLPRPVVEKIYNSLPVGKRKGYLEMTPAQTAFLKSDPQAWAQWRDSAVISRKGNMQFEAYSRGKWPMIALTVRPALFNATQAELTPDLRREPGPNGQHRYIMEQAKFIIEEVGLDGFYTDSFTGSKHWHYGYGYDKWDGVTVDIDPATGAITARYTDLALAGTESRREFIAYGLRKGGTVVTNGHPIARETQSLPAIRFNESEWVVDIYATPLGEKPPIQRRICEAHLASPVALGVRPHRYGEERGRDEYARIIMLTAIHYLRHGVLYYHYGTHIPEAGPGSGEQEPINRMFPITPIRLGEGFVEGRERVVVCVSGEFLRPAGHRPTVTVYDLNGRPVQSASTVAPARDGWRVVLKIPDWRSIAIVE